MSDNNVTVGTKTELEAAFRGSGTYPDKNREVSVALGFVYLVRLDLSHNNLSGE